MINESLDDNPAEEASVRLADDSNAEAAVDPEEAGADSPNRDVETPNSLPLDQEGTSGSVFSALLTHSAMELQLTTRLESSTDLVATYDFHAFFVKDQEICSYLDQFADATKELWQEDLVSRGASMPPPEGSELFAALVKRLQDKSDDTRVLLTVKKKVPITLAGEYGLFVHRLCEQMDMSAHDRKVVANAGYIHALARFQQSGVGTHSVRRSAETPADLLSVLHDQPSVVGILRRMYSNLARPGEDGATLELTGANILTIVDLLSDQIHGEHLSNRNTVATLKHELGQLIDKLFLRRVAEAFVQILEDDLPEETVKERNQALVYTDRIQNIFPLESRLRNEGLRVTTTEDLSVCMRIGKRTSPGLIVLRIHADAQAAIRVVHYLLSNGVDLSRIPTFVLVNGHHVEGLTGLLAMGIEDVLDMDGSLDSLMVKIKKARARMEEETRRARVAHLQKSGTSGNLSDMNLIDLLQAMGPSQRTACLTIVNDGELPGTLTVFLDKGNIIYAELDEMAGEAAIHQSLYWNQGNWVIEQVQEKDLPEPNSHMSNEAILMEGCRLLDERRKKSEA